MAQSMPTMDETYDYAQLTTPNAIRLLDFDSSKWDPATGIFDFKITTVDLDDSNHPSYFAVSYTWTLPELDEEVVLDRQRPSPLHILCDGLRLVVTENIFDCLCQLQQTKDQNHASKDPLGLAYLWIDAICVNQKDLEERSAQVALMQRIYIEAGYTLVWLGRHDRHSRRAIPIIKKFSEIAEPLLNNTDPNSGSVKTLALYGSLHDEAWYASVGLTPPSRGDWESVAAFLKRGWFHRLWTVQEYVQGRRYGNLQILCGDSEIQDNDILAFLALSSVRGWTGALRAAEDARTRDYRTMTSLGVQTSIKMNRVFRADLDASKDSDAAKLKVLGWHDEESFVCAKFAWLLYLGREKAASDQRDRVFAMSTLTNQNWRPKNWHLLAPNYSKSTGQVFADVSRFIFESLKNLSWLSFVEDRSCRVLKELPTWVPDLACHLQPTPLILIGSYDVFRSDGSLQSWSDFLAPLWSSQETELQVLGLKVDKIFTHAYDVNAAVLNHNMSAVLLAASRVPEPPAGEGWLITFMRTLMAGADVGKPYGIFAASVGSFDELFEAFLHFVKREISFEISKLSISGDVGEFDLWWDSHNGFQNLCRPEGALPSRQDFEDYYSLFKELNPAHRKGGGHPFNDNQAYLQAIHNPGMPFVHFAGQATSFRAFAGTDKARMGLVPVSTLPNDEVWLIAGASVPFILRARPDGTYELIGHAYMHGIMQGELFESGDRLSFERVILT